MDKWEYRSEVCEIDPCKRGTEFLKELVKWLNEWGAENWEAIETNEARDGKRVLVLFKRRIEVPADTFEKRGKPIPCTTDADKRGA